VKGKMMERLNVEKMIESFPNRHDEEIKLLKNEALNCWERIKETVGKPVEESRTYVEAQLRALFKILNDLQVKGEHIYAKKNVDIFNGRVTFDIIFTPPNALECVDITPKIEKENE